MTNKFKKEITNTIIKHHINSRRKKIQQEPISEIYGIFSNEKEYDDFKNFLEQRYSHKLTKIRSRSDTTISHPTEYGYDVINLGQFILEIKEIIDDNILIFDIKRLTLIQN